MITAVLLSLGTGLTLLAQAPWPASAGPAPAPAPYTAPVEQPRARRLVVAFLPSVVWGISPVPSFGAALFLGGHLPRGPWALGYQATFSSGLGDRYSLGLLAHRHHVTAMRWFGRRDLGFASVGGGMAFLAINPVIEAEARVGIRFGAEKRGILATQLRLGWDVGHRERFPMPQLGFVLGAAWL